MGEELIFWFADQAKNVWGKCLWIDLPLNPLPKFLTFPQIHKIKSQKKIVLAQIFLWYRKKYILKMWKWMVWHVFIRKKQQQQQPQPTKQKTSTSNTVFSSVNTEICELGQLTKPALFYSLYFWE